MLNRLTNAFRALLAPPTGFKMQTFTYFVPSPPARSTGYREKHFDKLFFEFINRGYEVKSLTTQASTGDKHSGMWVICLVQATTKEAEQLNVADFLSEQFKTQTSNTTEVEGLYYIDNQADE